MKSVRHPNLFLARFLDSVLIGFISIYTLLLFLDEPFFDLIIYFIPSFVLGALLYLTYKSEKLSGMLFVLVSFGFLLIYKLHISLATFLVLIAIGILLLSDVRKTFRARGKSRLLGFKKNQL